MVLGNHQKFHRTFFQFYIYRGNILSKKDLQKQHFTHFLSFIHIGNWIKYNFITHFLILILIRNKLCCRRISIYNFNRAVIIKSFITHLLILVAVRTDSNVPPFSKISLSHIYWALYRSGTYLIRKVVF